VVSARLPKPGRDSWVYFKNRLSINSSFSVRQKRTGETHWGDRNFESLSHYEKVAGIFRFEFLEKRLFKRQLVLESSFMFFRVVYLHRNNLKKNTFCYQKLFLWSQKFCKFKSFSRSLEHFSLTVGQNKFGNKIPVHALISTGKIVHFLKSHYLITPK